MVASAMCCALTSTWIFWLDMPFRQLGHVHQEYWIPADDLEAFNKHIIGSIQVIATFEAPE